MRIIVLSVLGIIGIFYFFAIKQWFYVESSIALIIGLVVLIGLSFLTALTEAAYAKVDSDRLGREFPELGKDYFNDLKDASIAIEDAKNSVRTAEDERDAISIASRDDRRTAENKVKSAKESLKTKEKDKKKLEKKIDRIRSRRNATTGMMRSYFVGALATSSMGLNLMVTALMPLTLYAIVQDDQMTTMDFCFWDGWVWQDNTVASCPSWVPRAFASKELFVFTVSSLPLIFFGKLIPKKIGTAFSRPLTFKLYFVGYAAYKFCGIVAITSDFFVDLVFKLKPVSGIAVAGNNAKLDDLLGIKEETS